MPTINDVARLAGVSTGTVSRVINGMSNVAPEIRERVEKAVADLGYVPNVFARSLRSRRANSISVVVPDITNGHWRDLLRGAEDAALSRGYVVLVCNHTDNPLKQRRYLEITASQNVAGVIIAPYDSTMSDLSPLIEKEVPTVLVNRRLTGWKGDGVYSDNLSGARALTRHLIQLGRRRIALIHGRKQISTTVERIQGYCMALEEAGLPVDPRLVHSDVRLSSTGDGFIEEILDKFSQAGGVPDAIFVWNNTLAPRVMQVLNRRGLHVPQDIAVVCFGDPTDMYFPFLTCIREPAYEIGMNAVQILFERLENAAEAPQRELVLPTRLVVRYSCGAQLSSESFPGTSLLIPPALPDRTELVRAVSTEEKQRCAASWQALTDPEPNLVNTDEQSQKPDWNRLADVLHFQPVDRLPVIQLHPPDQRLAEALLPNGIEGKLTPEQHVEMVEKLGVDALVCDFSWIPTAGSIRSWTDLDRLQPPVSPAEQVSLLERYLKAASQHGIGVGVQISSPLYACQAVEKINAPAHLLETVMDILQTQQQRVMRLVCDRFSDQMAFITLRDLIPETPKVSILAPEGECDPVSRLAELVTPAREHGIPILLQTSWSQAGCSPAFYSAGMSAVMFEDAALEDLVIWQMEWKGKMALVYIACEDLIYPAHPLLNARDTAGFPGNTGSRGGLILALTERFAHQQSAEKYIHIVRQVYRNMEQQVAS